MGIIISILWIWILRLNEIKTCHPVSLANEDPIWNQSPGLSDFKIPCRLHHIVLAKWESSWQCKVDFGLESILQALLPRTIASLDHWISFIEKSVCPWWKVVPRVKNLLTWSSSSSFTKSCWFCSLNSTQMIYLLYLQALPLVAWTTAIASSQVSYFHSCQL